MFNKTPFFQLFIIFVFSIFHLLPVYALNDNPNFINEGTFKYIDSLIVNHSDKNQVEIIKDNLKKGVHNNFYKEIMLDMIYATHIFDPLLDKNDIENSLKLILELKKEDSKKIKMVLYESIYHKRQGKWTTARPLLEFAYDSLNCIKDKTTEEQYLYSLAQFELAIFNQDQDLIVDSIGNLENLLNSYPDNIIFLTAISDLFRYIEVPNQLYNTFSEKIELYDNHLKAIKNKLFLKYSNNIFNKNQKYDEYYHKSIMEPLTDEILFRWKIAKYAQDQSADMMYFFQVDKNNGLKNVRLISTNNASKKLQDLTKRSIEDARGPFLSDRYLYETMDILFIFSFK